MDVLEVDRAFEAELDIELALARDAVAMVASGAARRVVVANLQHGRVIADPARSLAREAGLSLRTLPTADRRRVDLVVEPSTPGGSGDATA